MIHFPSKEERDFKERLEQKDGVENVEYDMRRSTKEAYISADIQEAGIDLWELHGGFDFNVVCSWHDPVKEKINMCFRVK